MPERFSWRAAERKWREADAVFKAAVNAEYYGIFRHQLMPPNLDGRLDRMVRRIVSNAKLVDSMERTRDGGVPWLSGDARLARSQWQLRDSVKTLLRHIRRPKDHPKGGMQGMGWEFRPLLRAFLRGACTEAQFRDSIGWALRLLEREGTPGRYTIHHWQAEGE